MKSGILIIVGGVVIVIAVCGVYSFFKSKSKSNEIESVPKERESDGREQVFSKADDVIIVKHDAEETIRNRHNEAAQEISASLHSIYDDGATDDIKTENSEALDKIDEELDNLLK